MSHQHLRQVQVLRDPTGGVAIPQGDDISTTMQTGDCHVGTLLATTYKVKLIDEHPIF